MKRQSVSTLGAKRAHAVVSGLDSVIHGCSPAALKKLIRMVAFEAYVAGYRRRQREDRS